MSKDKETVCKESVETVDKTIEYCQSTLAFWHLDKIWPTNLIYDALTNCRKAIKFIIVSDSHIIDK